MLFHRQLVNVLQYIHFLLLIHNLINVYRSLERYRIHFYFCIREFGTKDEIEENAENAENAGKMDKKMTIVYSLFFISEIPICAFTADYHSITNIQR